MKRDGQRSGVRRQSPPLSNSRAFLGAREYESGGVGPPHSRTPHVRVHIDRLVLDGVHVGAADRPHLQAAIEAELARLIASGGLSPELAQGVALPSVRAPQIALARDAKQLGTSIAGAVYGGVGGGGE